MDNRSLRRLSINLPASTYEELQLLASHSGRTMTEVVRSGLMLAKLAHDEGINDRSLAVVNKDGQVLKHLVIL